MRVAIRLSLAAVLCVWCCTSLAAQPVDELTEREALERFVRFDPRVQALRKTWESNPQALLSKTLLAIFEIFEIPRGFLPGRSWLGLAGPGPGRPELAKWSKMSMAEHANLADCLNRAILEAPLL